MPSELELAAARFRAELDRREAAAMRTMRRQLADVERQLARRLERHLATIETAEAAGRAHRGR